MKGPWNLGRKLTTADFMPNAPLDDGTVHWTHFVQTVWIAGVALLVRLALEATVLKALRKAMSGPKGARGRAKSVFDNLYVVIWSVATEVLAIYVTFNINGGCTPISTDSCLTGWPWHKVHVLQKWYMIVMFQMYLHELIGAVIKLGPKLKSDMLVHHLATMGLISTAYCLNLNRYGIMWQALFDTSNPLLHTAKALHAAGIAKLDGIKWMFFNLFALTFFVARVAMAPASILFPALTRAFDVLPAEWAIVLLALMSIVCGIQYVWFYKIVQMAMGKGGEEEEKPEADDGEEKKKDE